ncbi:LysR family transcriptional regulator [Thioclava sp. FTW29]|uniref:LysR family transcriptional regulator n=1 Tax=Thioclava litoralis TaxID=3076557 RepID=A0ABZ1E274_9RHOB|nr:LysR family transcriptional regulator [Thioclava sp. FTW29]
MRIDSEHLEILAMIVEQGGLTEGAEALGKSQPSVSRSMAILEKRLGLSLFEHGRRPLRPTDFGQELAKIGRRIHNLSLEASALVERVQSGRAGYLRMGGTPLFMDGVITPLLADLQEQVSGLQFEQVYGYYDSLASKLRNKTIDLAVLPLPQGQVPIDMVFTPILSGRNVIACRAGHPLTRRRSVELGDIATYSWVAPPQDSPLFRDLKQAIEATGASEHAKFTFSGGTLASITSFLARTDCLTMLPSSVVHMVREMLGITVLPVKVAHPDRQLGLLRLKNAEAPAALQVVSDHIRSHCAALQSRLDAEIEAL